MSDVEIKESDIRWMERASCKGMDISLFFPSDGVNLSKDIKAICDGCPVKMSCYVYAEKNHLDYGAFGGMSAKERYDHRRSQGRNSHQFKRFVA